jgi:hypothetical protein
MLVDTGGSHKVKVARANGSGFDAPVATNAPSDSEELVVGDFNGDKIADAGVLATTTAGSAKLMVMLGQGNDTFGSATQWWSGALDLSAVGVFVAAGDVNGDGKADLVMRDDDGAYEVAVSPASCGSFANWGNCTAPGGTTLVVDETWDVVPSWDLADASTTVTDFDRDGRDDIVAVKSSGSGISVVALRAKSDGGFASSFQLWNGAGTVADTVPVGLHADADGLGDVVLARRNGSGTELVSLRSIAKVNNDHSSASMVTNGSALNAGVPWSDANPF